MYTAENAPNSSYSDVIKWIIKHRDIISGAKLYGSAEDLKAVVNKLGKAIFKTINWPNRDLALNDCRLLRTAAVSLNDGSSRKKLALYEKCLRTGIFLDYAIIKDGSLDGNTLAIDKLDSKLISALKRVKNQLPVSKIRVGDSKEEFLIEVFFDCIKEYPGDKWDDFFNVDKKKFLGKEILISEALYSQISKFSSNIWTKAKNLASCTTACPELQTWLQNFWSCCLSCLAIQKLDLFEKDVIVLTSELFPLDTKAQTEILKLKSAIRIKGSQELFTHEEIQKIFNIFGDKITIDTFLPIEQKLFDIPVVASPAFMALQASIQKNVFEIKAKLDGKMIKTIHDPPAIWAWISELPENCKKDSFIEIAPKGVTLQETDFPLSQEAIEKLKNDKYSFIAIDGAYFGKAGFLAACHYAIKHQFPLTFEYFKGKRFSFPVIIESMGSNSTDNFKKFLMTADEGHLVDFFRSKNLNQKNIEVLAMVLDCEEGIIYTKMENLMKKWLEASNPSYPLLERLNRLKYQLPLGLIEFPNLKIELLGFANEGHKIKVHWRSTKEGLEQLKGGKFQFLDFSSYYDDHESIPTCQTKELSIKKNAIHLIPSQVSSLEIHNCDLNELDRIAHLPLNKFSLLNNYSYTKYADELKHLKILPLKKLALNVDSCFDPQGFLHLKDNTGLYEVSLKASWVQDEDIAKLTKALPNTVRSLTLNLESNQRITDAVFLRNLFFEGPLYLFYELKNLNIQKTQLTARAVDQLANQNNLEEIWLDEHQLSETAAKLFQEKKVIVHINKNLEQENINFWNGLYTVGLVAGIALFGIATLKK